MRLKVSCPQCRGWGWMTMSVICNLCHGLKTIDDRRTLTPDTRLREAATEAKESLRLAESELRDLYSYHPSLQTIRHSISALDRALAEKETG